MNNVHYSSKTPEWATPQDFFNRVQEEFGLEVDVCANNSNTKLPKFYSKEVNGLAQDWSGIRAWMNPPYGREIGKWTEKALRGGAAIVVALLPARTDTRWFHDHIYGKAEIRFVKGRIKFGGHENAAPFPNMIVIWKKHEV
jgi:site-specific DNA-methyltransferase (adenine-specific)